MGLALPTSQNTVIAMEDASQVGQARRAAQHLAQHIGLNEEDVGRVALSTTELASNVLKHAGGGEMHLRQAPGHAPGVEVVAVDRGKGFNFQACVIDGFSTGGTQGIGLGAVVRQASVFDAYSDHRGSVVLSRIYDRNSIVPDMRLGVFQHALLGDPACGDSWQVCESEDGISLLVIDGLGHGPEAEHAAKEGGNAFFVNPFLDPKDLLNTIHAAMNGTRGGAAAAALYTFKTETLNFSGIGNISARLISPGGSRGLVSMPGILGHQFRKAQNFNYPDVGGQLLILHSDGLQARWDIADYPNLHLRHPAVIAALLYRDFCRGKDDVTVLVIALRGRHV